MYKPESLRCKACCVVGDTSELAAQLQGTAAAAASMVEGGDSDSALYDVMNELQDTQQQSTNVRLPWGLVAQFVTTVFCSILLPVVGPIQGPSTDDGGSGRERTDTGPVLALILSVHSALPVICDGPGSSGHRPPSEPPPVF